MAQKQRRPSVTQRTLAGELRRLRQRTTLTLEQVGARLGTNAARLSRIERAVTRAPVKLVEQLCELLEASEQVTSALVAMAKDVNRPEWWREYEDVTAGQYVGLEAEAASLRTFESSFVPGLLQTPAYIRSVIEAGRPSSGPNELQRRVELRIKRQEALRRDTEPLQLWAILDESILHRTIGDPELMAEQLDHLVEMAALPNVEIQMMPYAVGAHPALTGSFTLLEFAEHPAVVYYETVTGGMFPKSPTEIDQCAVIFTHVCGYALDPIRSLEMIRRRASTL